MSEQFLYTQGAAGMVMVSSPDRLVLTMAEQGPAGAAVEPTGVAAGQYLKVTVDIYGRVTAGSNPANLSALEGLTGAADKVPYFTGSGAMAVADFTATGRSLVASADAAAARDVLALNTDDSPTFAGLTVTGTTALNGAMIFGDAVADTLTINAGTLTIGSNYTATRAAGIVAAGQVNLQIHTFTFTGDAGGTSLVDGLRQNVTAQGANAITGVIGLRASNSHGGSALIGTYTGEYRSIQLTSTGNITNANSYASQLSISSTGSVTGIYDGFQARNASISGGGTVGTYNGFRVLGLGHANVTTAVGLQIDDFSASTNMYGIRAQISAGTGKYNLYISGTAQNYFAGNVSIGTTAVLYPLDVRSSTTATIDRNLYSQFSASSTTLSEYNLIGALVNNAASGSTGKHGVYHIMTYGAAYAATGPSYNFRSIMTVNSAVTITGTMLGHSAEFNLTAAATVSNYYGYDVAAATNAGGGALGVFTGIRIAAQTVGTTIYGIRSQIAVSGTSRYNLFIDGTAPSYFAGPIWLGTSGATDSQIRVSSNITGAVNAYGAFINGLIQSDVTNAAYLNRARIATAAASFTLGVAYCYAAGQGTIGAGSAITTQIGFMAEGDLIGATSNMGFFGNIPVGTGRWNVYMIGTAQNHLAGLTGFGITVPLAQVHIVNATNVNQFRIQNVTTDTTTKTGTIGVGHYTNAEEPVLVAGVTSASTTTSLLIGGGSSSFNTATSIDFYTAADNTTVTGTLRLRIDSAGRIGINVSSPNTSSLLHLRYSGTGTISDAIANAGVVFERDNDFALNIITPNTNTAYINFGDPEDSNTGRIFYNHSSNYLAVGVNGSTERARWTSAGGYLVGTTTDTNLASGDIRIAGALWLADGITAPTTTTGFAAIYVDTADGDLKVKFGDGTIKTIVVDT